jgi:hypothetical protein
VGTAFRVSYREIRTSGEKSYKHWRFDHDLSAFI